MPDSLTVSNYPDTLPGKLAPAIDIADGGDRRVSRAYRLEAFQFDTAFPLVIFLSLAAWVLVVTAVLWLAL